MQRQRSTQAIIVAMCIALLAGPGFSYLIGFRTAYIVSLAVTTSVLVYALFTWRRQGGPSKSVVMALGGGLMVILAFLVFYELILPLLR
jgi:hypothetical protein